jgi:hypothetical protein
LVSLSALFVQEHAEVVNVDAVVAVEAETVEAEPMWTATVDARPVAVENV